MDIKAKPGCCEEASTLSHNFYIPCDKPAEVMVIFKNGEGPYRMCGPCARHNIRNRGAESCGPYDPHIKIKVN